MKNGIAMFVLLWFLLSLLFWFFINKRDIEIVKLKSGIDSLQAEIDTLQKYSIKTAAPGFIQIGETTIQCMTADPEKYLHIDSLTQGENFKDYAINDHQRVEMFIFNY